MKRNELAEALRKRQNAITDQELRKKLHFNDFQIYAYRVGLQSSSDEEMIDSYITCSCCGDKYVEDEKTLEYIIANCTDVEDFLDKTASYAEHKQHYRTK